MAVRLLRDDALEGSVKGAGKQPPPCSGILSQGEL
jgi:hypothetical protein